MPRFEAIKLNFLSGLLQPVLNAPLKKRRHGSPLKTNFKLRPPIKIHLVISRNGDAKLRGDIDPGTCQDTQSGLERKKNAKPQQHGSLFFRGTPKTINFSLPPSPLFSCVVTAEGPNYDRRRSLARHQNRRGRWEKVETCLHFGEPFRDDLFRRTTRLGPGSLANVRYGDRIKSRLTVEPETVRSREKKKHTHNMVRFSALLCVLCDYFFRGKTY